MTNLRLKMIRRIGAAGVPATLARNCAHEYFALANAFHKEISPHIDFTLAKTILEAKWLPDPAQRPSPDFDSASR